MSFSGVCKPGLSFILQDIMRGSDTQPLSPAPQQLHLGAEELRINHCLQPGCWLECKCLNFGEVTSVKWFNAVCCQELMNSVLQQVVP